MKLDVLNAPMVGPKITSDFYAIRTIINKWGKPITETDKQRAFDVVLKSSESIADLYSDEPMIRFDRAMHFLIGKMGVPEEWQKQLTHKYDNGAGMFRDDYALVYNYMTEAKIVRFEQHFSKIIEGTNAPAFGNINMVKPVFSIVFAEYDGGIYIEDFDARIDSMLIVCLLVTDEQIKREGLPSNVIPGYRFGAFGFGYDGKTGSVPVDVYSMARVYDMEGNFVPGSLEWTGMLAVARATLDMLSSPSVRLEDVDVAKINKARQKKDKPPVSPWKIIRWSMDTRQPQGTGAGIRHGVRYDVRGNWATFTKGRLAGRMIWRSPHQRGLSNLEYKPKTYEVK